ncbi:hypothetical protein [Crateriforma conspicua]|uniref:Uncharacterized protein n=1 Tax=Crateriforma conspicua TaxID=2527996 RepID=A0A5C5Y5S8_9PLAN|nr:hypothetical protein [Crateriforma conspicua]TWT70011.1 hypothetical protein Pan14r_23080 [Crateriforma conspicua]
MKTKPVYVVKLQPVGDASDLSLRGLRAILKSLGRGYRLRCISVGFERVEPSQDDTEETNR